MKQATSEKDSREYAIPELIRLKAEESLQRLDSHHSQIRDRRQPLEQTSYKKRILDLMKVDKSLQPLLGDTMDKFAKKKMGKNFTYAKKDAKKYNRRRWNSSQS